MRSRRNLRWLPAGLLAVALLAACGEETSSDSLSTSGEAIDAATDSEADDGPTLSSRTLGGDPLDLAEASTALLAGSNLPGFEPDSDGPTVPDPPDETDGLPACETEDTFADRFDYPGNAVTRVTTDYTFFDDARLLFTSSTVASFQNDEQAAAALDEVAAQFGECSSFEETQDGATVSIDIASDEEPATDDADDGFNLTATGTVVEVGTETLAMGFGFSLARVDNNVTMTEVMSLGVPGDAALLAPYTAIAVDRLVAVMNGEAPEDVAGPGPTPAPPASRLPTGPEAFSLERFNAVAPRFGLAD